MRSPCILPLTFAPEVILPEVDSFIPAVLALRGNLCLRMAIQRAQMAEFSRVLFALTGAIDQ